MAQRGSEGVAGRLLFPIGQQAAFLQMVYNKSGLKASGLATLLNVHSRTVRDWKREKFSMSLFAVTTLCQQYDIPFPIDAKIVNPFWYASKGAQAGALAVLEKYDRPLHSFVNEQKRQKKWQEWWQNTGQHLPHPIIGVRKSIRRPRRSKELAEFMGIMIGDGGITDRQITVTLHSEDDKAYGDFVSELIEKLFGIYPRAYPSKKHKFISYVVSRTDLVNYCEGLGLKIGHKIHQQINIPDWIMKNKTYQIACLRGLVDTDGSVYTHFYTIKGKRYGYKKLSFASMSSPLRASVITIMKDLGLKPRVSQGRDIHLESVADVRRYFELVGSHNAKHLNRYGRRLYAHRDN